MRQLYYPESTSIRSYVANGDDEWRYEAVVTHSDGHVIDVEIIWESNDAPEILDPVARRKAIREWQQSI